jgi:hypothetical protein
MTNYFDPDELYDNSYKKSIRGGSIIDSMPERILSNGSVGQTFSENHPQTGLNIKGGCAPCINFKYKQKSKNGGRIRLII